MAHKKVYKYEVYKDRKKKIRWRCRASNGRIVAHGGEAFSSRFRAKKSIRSMREHDFDIIDK